MYKYTLYRISDDELLPVAIKTTKSKKVLLNTFNLLKSALPQVEEVNKYAFRSGNTCYSWMFGSGMF